MIKINSKIFESKTELIIFFGFWIFYCFTISQNYSLSHDSTYYLNEIEYGDWIFHPHHLLFHIVAKVWINILNYLPIINQIDIAYKVGSLNSLFGALSLSYLFRYAKNELKFSHFYSLSLVFIIGSSFAFWYYSGCAEVYIIPLFFILKSIYSLFGFSKGKTNINKSIIYLSIATLFHQSNIILFGAVLIFVLIFKRENILNNILKSLGISFLIIGLPYLYAGIIYNNNYSFAEYMSWLMYYSHEVPEHWSRFGIGMILNDAVGFLRTFFSTYFLYSIEQFKNLLISAFKDKWLGEEIFLTRNMGSTLGIINLSGVIIVAISYISLVILNLNKIKSNYKENKKLVNIFLIYFLVLSVFFTFWSSSNPEFWIPQNVIFWILSFILLKNEKVRINRYLLIVIIALNIFVNFFGGIYYSMNKENDYYYNRISGIIADNKNSDLVITPNRLVLKDYLIRYKMINYFSIEEVIFKYKDFTILKNKLDSAIQNNKSEYIFATFDLKNLESDKYSVEFKAFVNEYFSNDKYELTVINPQKINEYYKIRKRQNI